MAAMAATSMADSATTVTCPRSQKAITATIQDPGFLAAATTLLFLLGSSILLVSCCHRYS